MKHKLLNKLLVLTLLTLGGVVINPAWADVYDLVTDAGDLSEGDIVLIVDSKSNGTAIALSGYNSQVSVTVSSNTITIATPGAESFTLGGNSSDGWSFKNTSNKYVAYSGSKTALTESATASGNALWTISINGTTNVATITVKGGSRMIRRYSTTDFRAYESTSYGADVYIYKKRAAIVATPTFSPAAGTFDSAQSVTISTETAGATIYYTTDGTTPSSSNGTEYTGAITVSSTQTIKAIAVKDGMTDSGIATAAYTITTSCATPTFSPAAGTYGSAQSVTISTETAGATIHFTTDGSTPTSSSATFSSAITVSSTQTIKAIAVKDGMDDSEVATALYTITTPCATPTFSVAEGTYTSDQNVTISTETAGATIYYTTDGTTPSSSNGTEYTSAITVSSTQTIKAIAVKDGMADSEVASATYTINKPVTDETITFSELYNANTVLTDVEIEADYFSVTFAKPSGTAPQYYTTGTAVRAYGGNTFTVSSATKTIEKIELTFGSSDGSNTITTNVGSYSDGTWTGSASSVKFTIGGSTGNRRISAIKVTYASGGGSTVFTPTFSPDGSATYTTSQNVTITCATEDATIYYTTNGDDPDESSTPYADAIPITTSGTVLKAIAYKDGMTESSIASATYTIKPTTPTITAEGATVTISGADGCTFYYTTDETIPTNSSISYSAPFDLDEDCKIIAIAYDANGNASDVTSPFTFKYMPLAPKNINSGYFAKVTNVNNLENGDAILIVNEDYNQAMGTHQNDNNRGEYGVSISDGVIYSPSVSVQRLVLVKKSEKINEVDTDVFYFYTGAAGYLYAASSGSNYLRTEETPDNNNNARATITISSGDATIKFTGTYTRNWLQYNSNNDIFSCYGSNSQSLVQIYKEVAHTESVPVTSAGYATYCSPYALDFTGSGIEAYTGTIAGTTLTFTPILHVPANTGLLLVAAGGATEDVPVIASADAVANNCLTGVNEATDLTSNDYILNVVGGKAGFYKAGTYTTLAAHRAYIPAALGGSVKSFYFDLEDDATDLNSLTPAISEGEGAIYNLAGQRINKMQKGINIVNGKKVMK